MNGGLHYSASVYNDDQLQVLNGHFFPYLFAGPDSGRYDVVDKGMYYQWISLRGV